MRWINPVTLAVLVAIAGMLGYALWRDRPPAVVPIESLTGFQDAAAPLMLPADGKPRLHFFPAWQEGNIPTATRFDQPMGSAHGALTRRTGEVLDGIGGPNTDLGDPVFAVADGLVVFAGEPFPEQGKVIILAHRDRHGRLLESVYAQLDRVDVAVDMLVPRGKKIGTVGTANGRYPARLRFEMVQGDGVDFGAARHESVPTLETLAGSAPDDLSPSPLATALVPAAEPWTGLEIQGAEKLGEILAE